MKILYADESGNTGTDLDNKSQPIFVLAGVLVDEYKWHEINDKFNEEKIKILPILKDYEIHTNELFNSSKKSIFNKYDWQDNFKTLERLVDLICELDISVNYIAIDKKNFKKSVSDAFDSAIKIDPYIYSFVLLYDYVSDNLARKNNKGIIFLDEILTIPKKVHNIYPVLSRDNNTMIEEAMFIKSKNTNFIQIADIFAFYIEKYWSIGKGYKTYGKEKQEHCLKMYEELSKKINIIGTEFIEKYVPFKSKEFYL